MKLDNLQGIKADESGKIDFYRRALGLKMGAETAEKTVDLLAMLADDGGGRLRAVECFCGYLRGQENGGAILDSLFRDITSTDALTRRLSLIRELIGELDAAEDFPGKAESRNMLAGLSVKLKSMLPALLKSRRIAAFQ